MCNVFNNVIRSGRVRGAFDVNGSSIAAGNYHSVIYTSEGREWTFGRGSYGTLGHGGNTNELVPRLVEVLVNVKVAKVATGLSHTVVFTAEGRMLGFARNVDHFVHF